MYAYEIKQVQNPLLAEMWEYTLWRFAHKRNLAVIKESWELSEVIRDKHGIMDYVRGH